MQLKCQSCGHELHPRDVDFSELRASCRHCGWQLGGAEGSAYRRVAAANVERVDQPPPTSRPLPPLPSGITVTEWGSGDDAFLEVNIEPAQRWALLFLVPVFFGQLALLGYVGGSLAFMIAPFWCLLIYVISVHLGNTRHVYVTHSAVTMSSSPLPWPRREIPVSEIEQLWVDETRDRNRNVTYRLRARLGQKDIVIVNLLEDVNGALHLERRIEERLGIVDVPVLGEIDAPR